MLSSELINDFDRKITMDDLDPAVITVLNESVADGSIGPKAVYRSKQCLKPIVVGLLSSVVHTQVCLLVRGCKRCR